MPARVYSIDSIEAFRVALLKFKDRVEGALVELDRQLQKATHWIEEDRPAHWRKQINEADKAIHEAKLNLEHCLIYRVTDQRPACREERALLKDAQVRRDYCRDKLERVRHWKRNLHHQLYEYQGRISHLNRLLEQDLPQANATLKKIMRQLHEYQLEKPPMSFEEPQQPNLNPRSTSATQAHNSQPDAQDSKKSDLPHSPPITKEEGKKD